MSTSPHNQTADTTAAFLTQHEHPFDLDASLLCLDFINTITDRGESSTDDLLRSYSHLVWFGVATESLSTADASVLLAVAEQQPDAAQAVFEQGCDLRELLFAIFAVVAAGNTPDDVNLTALSAIHRDLHRGTRVVAHADGYTDTWIDPTDLRRALWPIATSAVDLLVHGPVERVRECASDTCRWIFLDVSRNHSRRWCSMKSCGNRAKVAEFRKRQSGRASS